LFLSISIVVTSRFSACIGIHSHGSIYIHTYTHSQCVSSCRVDCGWLGMCRPHLANEGGGQERVPLVKTTIAATIDSASSGGSIGSASSTISTSSKASGRAVGSTGPPCRLQQVPLQWSAPGHQLDCMSGCSLEHLAYTRRHPPERQGVESRKSVARVFRWSLGLPDRFCGLCPGGSAVWVDRRGL
jgi:hypothetical protein